MQYRIKERFWSLGDNFYIENEAGERAYRVKGKVFSWGDKLSFQDAHGEELAFISQKLISLRPKYTISRGGETFAEVTKEFTWLRRKFTLDVPGPNDYTITGSFWEHEFEFVRSGQTVATVSKRLVSLRDSYGVKIAPGEDEVAILCTCIVIDQVLHDDKD
ncbi:MAG: LURP-one-related family protein [Catalinimonas sp.]